MKRRKVWMGVGTAVLLAPGVGAAGAEHASAQPAHDLEAASTPTAMPMLLAQAHQGHGATLAQARKASGEGGEGEGGAAGDASLPPALRFYRDIQLVRGHLLIGEELLAQGRWAEALPHFLHPEEELYGKLRADLKSYDVPPFQTALKALAQTVKAKNREAYVRALASLNERLDAADRGVRAKESGAWSYFALETALEALRTAASEYEVALKGDGKRITNVVEYQDSRGFVLQAERLVQSVADELAKKDSAAFEAIRAAFADLKQAWPAPMPPKAPVKDVGTVLADVSKIELQLARFR